MEQQHPKTMKAAAAESAGGPDVVHVVSIPVPELGPGELLVEVAAAGVGRWDPALVAGEFDDGGQRNYPRVYGSDGAGKVVAVGNKVKGFKPGDSVYGFGFGNKKGGFFAEYAAVPEANAAPLPSTIKVEEAGALAVSGLTALEGLEELALDEGKTLLLIGASGGVGHVALQLAKCMGLKVFAVASGEDGVALCKRLGADGVVDGKGDGVADAARAFAPGGYDGALVLAAEEDGPRLQELTEQVHGKLAHPHGAAAPKEGVKDVRVVAYDGEPRREAFERLNELVGRGPFHVELSKTYKLTDTAQALRDVGEHHVGKLAVIVH